MAGLPFSGLMRGLLFGVSAFDPATFGAAAAVLLATAALASWIHVARAARLNPSQTLRALEVLKRRVPVRTVLHRDIAPLEIDM